MKKMLPINTNIPITTEIFNYIRLSAILTDRGFIPWYLEKFIVLFIDENFFFTNYYIYGSLSAKYIYDEVIKTVPIEYNKNIIKIIKEHINCNGYVQILCDKYYIRGSVYYKKTHFFHEILITGYNEEKSILYFTDLNINNKLTGIHNIKEDELQESWEQTLIFIKDKKPKQLYDLSFMQLGFPISALYLRKENIRKNPDLNNIYYSLQYLKNKPVFQAQFCGLDSINKTGLDIYKIYYNNLYNTLKKHKNENILFEHDNIILISLKRLIENKAGISYRIKYLMDEQLLRHDETLIKKMNNLTSNIEYAFDCLTKYAFTNNTGLLDEFAAILKETEQIDSEIIDECLELTGRGLEKKYYTGSHDLYENTINNCRINNKENKDTYEELIVTYSKEIPDKINHISDKIKSSPVSIVLSILTIILSRYTGSEKTYAEIVINTSINENDPDVNSNSKIHLESDLSGNIDYDNLCKDIEKQVITDNNLNSSEIHHLSHVSFKFIQLDETMNYEKSTGNEQSSINFIIYSDCSELSIKSKYLNNYFLQFKHVFEDHFQIILNEILNNPLKNIHEIEMITQLEKNTILENFNNTSKNYNENLLISMFEKTVDNYPGKTMIIIDDKYYSYDFINKKVNQLANYLRFNSNIKPGDYIGLFAEGGIIELVIGLLGIMKSGGIYVPLDPASPLARNQFIINDTDLDIILQTSNNNLLLHEKEIINISLENKKIYANSTDNPELINNPGDIAYVIYTSGTSGKPKGVLIKHESIANTILWRINEYAYDPCDTAMLLFSHIFDGFMAGFFTPVLSGTGLVMLKKNQVNDPGFIIETICKNKVSSFISIPHFFSVLGEMFDKNTAGNIKFITLAGDRINKQNIENFSRKFPWIEIINEYGPTENSVVSTIKRNLQKDDIVTIGKPIANTRVFIVNKKNKLVPLLAPGEICLSGTGISAGYLNRKKLNDRCFVKNPYSGEIMYKTGDMGKWLPDGNIEFLGRIDFQVKIRGYRIEISEIESSLQEHPEIRDTAVVLQGKSDENKFICAFYTTINNNDIFEPAEWLKDKIPGYMIPLKFIRLDKLPVTQTGKLDRKKLENTECNEVSKENEYKNMSKLEKQIFNVWQNILDTSNIGLEDDFFTLGGNSISIIKMQVCIEKDYNIKLDMKNTGKYTTIKKLAGIVSSLLSNNH